MSDMAGIQQKAAAWIDANKAEFHRLSDAVFTYAELGMEEFESTQAIVGCRPQEP